MAAHEGGGGLNGGFVVRGHGFFLIASNCIDSSWAGLVPAIHVFENERRKAWMPGTGPGMTRRNADRGIQIEPSCVRSRDVLLVRGLIHHAASRLCPRSSP